MRPRISSPEQLVNTSSPSAQGGPLVAAVNPANPVNPVNNPNATLIAGTNVRLPTFNGNGTEDPKQHWFLSKEIQMVCLVNNDDIQKAQMIMNLKGRALDWYMKYCVVPLGYP